MENVLQARELIQRAEKVIIFAGAGIGAELGTPPPLRNV